MEEFKDYMTRVFDVLLNSLDGKDRVLVLFFGTDHTGNNYRIAGTLNCLKNLTSVTPASTKTLKEHVKNINFSGALSYVALFGVSLESFDSSDRPRFLHVITSGKFTDKKDPIADIVAEKSKLQNCSVTLNVFLLTSGGISREKREVISSSIPICFIVLL